ncbi:MAG: hypothetical protein ACRDV2_07945, partial [Actinomycetes bacterium]
LEERLAPGSYDGHRRRAVASAVLELLHEDDAVLRQPAPPLQRLSPAPPPDTDDYGRAGAFDTRTLHVELSPQVYAALIEAAGGAGVPVDTWVADELARLHAWPRRPWPDRYGGVRRAVAGRRGRARPEVVVARTTGPAPVLTGPPAS